MRARPGLLSAAIGFGFLAAFVVGPVLWVVGGAWWGAASAGSLAGTLTEPVTVRAAENSLLQGALGAAGAVALGLPAGIALGRYRLPGRPLLLGVLLVAFLLPNLVMVEGVTTLFGPSAGLGAYLPGLRPLSTGLPGIVVVDTLYNAPIVALLTALGISTADRRLEESVAVLGGGPWERFRRVWGPPALAGASAAATLTFALSALAFAAPIALGGPAQYTLEARIWSLDQQLVLPSEAQVVAGLGLALLVVPALAYVALVGRLRPRSAGAEPPPRSPSEAGPLGLLAFALLGLLLAAEGAVLGSALARLGEPGTPAAGGGWAAVDLFARPVGSRLGLPTEGALANSAIFAGSAAAIALLVGLALVWATRGWGARARGLASGLPFLSVLVSPIILALSLYVAWGPLLGGASEVWLLIVLSQAAVALPFAVSGLTVALARVPRAVGESAVVLGASPGFAFRDVELPSARRGVAAAALLALAVALGEFTATFFLAPPRFETATVELYRLTEIRWTPEAWALGGILALATAAALGLAAVGGARADR